MKWSTSVECIIDSPAAVLTSMPYLNEISAFENIEDCDQLG